ncbi:MAG: extracellular solute-binding protein, partial [Bacteroidota bacterium]
ISLLLLLLLASCENKSKDNATTVTANQQTYGTVNLVTFRHLVQDQEIVKAFEERYRLKVNVEVVPAATIIRRAQEGVLGGDVVITPTLEDIVRLKNFDQLQPFFVDAFSRGNVDDGYLDDQGYFAGLSRWTMAAVFNPNAVAIEEVSTYKNIAKLPLRGIRIGMAHPDSSGLAATVAGLTRIVNDRAATLWTKLLYDGLTGSMIGNDYDVMDRMLKGDLDVAFVSSGAAVRWFLNGNPTHFKAAEAWRVKYPATETDEVNFFNMTSIGVIKNAPNRPQALQFIDFLFKKENQEKMGDAIFEYPTEAFSISNDYLSGIRGAPGRKISATETASRLPLAWGIINQVASGE